MFNYTKDDYGCVDDSVAAKMNITLNTWLNNPNKKLYEVAELAGISTDTFLRYRQNRFFMDVYNEQCKIWFESLQAKAIQCLENRIDKDDFNSAKYVLDNNCYAAPTKIEAQVDNSIVINITDEGD